jgi:hypothetical protein
LRLTRKRGEQRAESGGAMALIGREPEDQGKVKRGGGLLS